MIWQPGGKSGRSKEWNGGEKRKRQSQRVGGGVEEEESLGRGQWTGGEQRGWDGTLEGGSGDGCRTPLKDRK